MILGQSAAWGQDDASAPPVGFVATPVAAAPVAYPRGYDSPAALSAAGAQQAGAAYSSGQAPVTPLKVLPGGDSAPYGGAPDQSAPGIMGAGSAYPGAAAGGIGGAGGAAGAAALGAAGGMGADAFGGPSGAGANAPFATTAESALQGFGGPGGVGESAGNFAPNMIGDLTPVTLRTFQPQQGPPPLPGVRPASVFSPSVRVLKMSENQSPRPQDRFFYSFNYFNNVNQAMNIYDRSPIRNMEVYRHVLGFEKTFDEGRGSFGMRLPIETLTADPAKGVTGLQTPTSTSTGNLSMFAKYILKENRQTGSLASVGLAIAPPTAPERFAGSRYVFPLNNTTFQPFFGYVLNFGDFYIQGFSSFLFTSSIRDSTMMFNDVGIGYYLYRNNDPNAFLTAFVPNFEVHVNSPFTHRDWKNRLDPAATSDIVNLTYGLNFQFGRSALLSTALVTPVTGPRPFDAELAVLLNVFYGRTRAGLIPIQPPPMF